MKRAGKVCRYKVIFDDGTEVTVKDYCISNATKRAIIIQRDRGFSTIAVKSFQM